MPFRVPESDGEWAVADGPAQGIDLFQTVDDGLAGERPGVAAAVDAALGGVGQRRQQSGIDQFVLLGLPVPAPEVEADGAGLAGRVPLDRGLALRAQAPKREMPTQVGMSPPAPE